MIGQDRSPDRDRAALRFGASLFTVLGALTTAGLVWTVDSLTTAERAGLSALMAGAVLLGLGIGAFALRRVRRRPSDPSPAPVRRQAVHRWGAVIASCLIAMAIVPALDLPDRWTVELFGVLGLAACLATAGLLRSTVWR